jgi:phosphinothricin acetyltransferase
MSANPQRSPEDTMSDLTVRPATRTDLPQIVAIYNYYILNTPITFDLEPMTVETRTPWFEEHTRGGRHQLMVAEHEARVVGYAGTGRFRDKAAYDISAETTIYCAHDSVHRGIGSALYRALFTALKNEDLHRILAGITIPNHASVAFHRRFGFTDIGVFSEVGRKFGRYWDVLWMERPLTLPGD